MSFDRVCFASRGGEWIDGIPLRPFSFPVERLKIVLERCFLCSFFALTLVPTNEQSLHLVDMLIV